MKIIEISGQFGQLLLPLTNEETDLLGKFADEPEVHRQDLNEREVHVANQLVNKDVLYRKNQHGRITYRKKSSPR